MSYILEALKKAEQERTLGQVPTLETKHTPALPSRRRLWPWLITSALLANALVMATIFLPSLPPPPSEQSKPQASEPLTVKAAAIESSLQLTPAKQDTVKSPSPSAPHKTEALTDKMYTPPVSTAAAEAPPLQSLPGEFRHSFAELNLDVHVFSKEPAARFVLINAKRYQEGERLSEGPLLEAITPKGVILHHRGRRFLLAVTH